MGFNVKVTEIQYFVKVLCSQLALHMLTLRPQTMGKRCLCGGSLLTLSSGKSGLVDMFYMYMLIGIKWLFLNLILKVITPVPLYDFAVGNFEEILETRRMQNCSVKAIVLSCVDKENGLDVIVPSPCLNQQLQLCSLFVLPHSICPVICIDTFLHFCVILRNFSYCHRVIHFAFVRRTVFI